MKTHQLQKDFNFLNIYEHKTFSAFNMHHSKPHHHFSNHFWLHLLFFMHFMIYFELKWPWIEKHCKWTLKWLKVGMVSSFQPHSMCKKVERVTVKTGCTSCTKWTISFEVSGFQTKTRLLQRYFIFLNLFQLQTFCAFNTHHSKPHPQMSTLSNFICYFSRIYWFFWTKWSWNWKALQMNSEKVETGHGIIISPT